MDYPKITIVTPSYNQGAYIEKTLKSVLIQGYPNLEYIVIDGGSTDNSADIIRKYSDQLAYWTSEPDKGQSDAINKGMARATGEILGWLNSDDMLEPGALSEVAAAAARYPSAGVFVGHGRKVDINGKEVYYKEPGDLSYEGLCRWLSGGNFMQPSCFWRRDVWDKAGPLDENIHFAMDVDLWLKMVKVTKFQKIDKLLSSAIYHEEAKTAAFRHKMEVDCAIVVIRAGGEPYVRHRLEKMADRLAYLEGIVKVITSNPLYKVVRPFIKGSKANKAI
jgi:glycosyltransferase involved in cell wall biosynthesis